MFRQHAVFDRPPVEHKAQQAPQGQQEECLAPHGLHGGQAGDELHHGEQSGDHRADDAQDSLLFIPLRFRDLPCGGAGVPEADDGPEGGKVDEPVQGVPSQERQHDGDHHDKEDTEARPGKPLGEDAILRHCGEDPGGGAVPADNPRQDAGERGDDNDGEARGPHDASRGEEGRHGGQAGQAIQGGDILLP